jgi:hypothetical protein
MNRHSQHYLDLNPEPSAASLLIAGAKYLALTVYAAGVVYLSVVVLFSL